MPTMKNVLFVAVLLTVLFHAALVAAKDPKFVQVKGKAFLPDGGPAEGMELLISGTGGGTSNSYIEPNGNFSIHAFPNANYMLSIFDPKGKWAAPSQFLTVKNEDEYAKEIVFQLEEGTRVTGKVVDETTGNPVPNMEISISFCNDKPFKGADTFFTIKSDENGGYGFAASATDKVYVNVGSLPIGRGTAQIPGQAHRAKLLKKVSFDDRPVVNLDLRIPSPFVGRVLLADGSPAAGASVIIHSSRDQYDYDTSSFVDTDKDGVFRLTERPRNVVCTIWSHHRENFVGWFDDDLPKTGEKVFQLQRECRINGRLLDSVTKKPLADQLILVEQSDVANPKQLNFAPFPTRTDGEGFFEWPIYITAGIRHEVFIVSGLQVSYGGMPTTPRTVLATVTPETPGEIVSLGDLEVNPLAKKSEGKARSGNVALRRR